MIATQIRLTILQLGKWSPNFIGVDNRIKIRSEKIVLEYALNLWFETTFRQPPNQSDIYIVNQTSENLVPFVFGQNYTESSTIFSNTASGAIYSTVPTADHFGFTIFVPISVHHALNSNSTIANNIIKDFANKYVACGVKYQIQTY